MLKGYKELTFAMFQRAFDDYAHLRKIKETKHWIKDEGSYSIREIRNFLCSDWGKVLLDGIGANITGIELVEELKKVYT